MHKRITSLLVSFLAIFITASAQKSVFDFEDEHLSQAQTLLDSDFVAGVKVLNAEAQRNNPLAIYYLASAYTNKYSQHFDLNKAEQLLLKLSDKGYPEIYSLLGAIYNSNSKPYSLNRDDLAIKWYTKAVEAGETGVKGILSEFYLEGRGGERDYEKAFQYAYASSQDNQFDKFSSYVLGQCYLNGYGTPQNFMDAAVWFRRSAELGYPKAQTELGNCYDKGIGVVPNPSEARHWFSKAAEQGEKTAQSNLGNCYTYGIGGDVDYPEGMRYYKLSAEQGFPVAQYNIGLCYYHALGVDNDDAEAVRWFQLSAEQDYDMAHNALGNCYRYGRGVEQDYKKAFRQFQLAVKNNNPYALVNLADMYRFGLGVTQQLDSAASNYMYAADNGYWFARDSLRRLPLTADSLTSLRMIHASELFNNGYYEVSSRYFLRLAAENNSAAQFIVGFFYLHGNFGLPADTICALDWINKAVDQGNDQAQDALASLYIDGTVVPKDYAKALKLLEQSASKGNAGALNDLGWMYEKGNGVPRNDEKALYYYQQAAKKNFSTAFFHLGQFYEQGRVVSMDKELAQHYYELADSAGEARASDALTKLLSPNMPHRYALLMANDDYRVRLDNPINDERDFEKKLKGLGFQIMRCLNRDYKSMKDSIAKFCDLADGCDVALFYYAGHALQDRGVNYLIPAQPTRPSNEADYVNVYVDLPFVINSMKNRTFKRRIVILDACRDVPDYISVASRGAESHGLAAITELKDFLIAYSTQAGETAQDGPRGGNSPYMRALLEELDVPQQDLDNVFIHIRERVDELTDSKQVPFYVNGLREGRNDKFIFNCKNNKQHANQVK